MIRTKTQAIRHKQFWRQSEHQKGEKRFVLAIADRVRFEITAFDAPESPDIFHDFGFGANSRFRFSGNPLGDALEEVVRARNKSLLRLRAAFATPGRRHRLVGPGRLA
jgi:hypothetical protein